MAINILRFSFAVVFSLGVMSSTASALPAIENLSFDWETTATGNSRCGSETLNFTLGYDSVNDTDWGYQITVNGVIRNRMTIKNRSSDSSLSYANNIFGAFIKGIPNTIEVAAYNEDGIGAPQSVTFTMPICKGPLDGTAYLSTDYALVSFSDFASIPPFTPTEFEQNSLHATTLNGEEISINEYFNIISNGKVEVIQEIYPWVVLPKTMEEYCGRQIYQESWRQLTLGYDCNTAQIQSDTLELLAQQGITPNADVVSFIINGMGTVGSGGYHSTAMSADNLLYEGTQAGENYFSYRVITHEIFHATFSMRHSNSFYDCAQGPTPSDFLNGNEGIDCDTSRYGVSVMGGATFYTGLSAPQRLRAGVLDASAVIELDNPSASNFTLSDLDTIDSEKKLVLISDDKLPERYQVFIEYSKDNQRLNFSPNSGHSTRAGIRMGILDANYGLGSATKLGDDGEVVYFSDVELANIGEKVLIEGLNLELSILNKDSTTVELSLTATDSSACAEIEVTLAEHEAAGRAYSETTTEGETCYGTWCFGGTEVTTWYAVGSDENLGTDGNNTIILHEESDGVFATGACPGPDVTAPVITLVGDNPMTIYQGSEFADPGATAEDNIDGDLTAVIVVAGSVETNTIGTYQLTYTVSDAAGNEATVTRTVNVIAVPACQEFTDSVANHEAAGRAYSQTETTGETCYGTFCWGGTTTTVWYAQGSDQNLGTNGSASVTLKTSANGYETGNCPTDPQPPVIESYEISQLNYNSAVITGIASDPDGDIDHILLGIGAITGVICEGTTSFTCTLVWNDYGFEVGAQISLSLSAFDSRDERSNLKQFTITRPEQQASVPPVIGSIQQTREGTVEIITFDVTDVDGDLDAVFLYRIDDIGMVECSNVGGDQYRCEMQLQGASYATMTWKVRAIDLAENVTDSDDFIVEWEESASCYSATNSEHVSANRATLKYNVLVYANGSNDYLGMGSDTTSLEETSAGVWSKVVSCQ